MRKWLIKHVLSNADFPTMRYCNLSYLSFLVSVIIIACNNSASLKTSSLYPHDSAKISVDSPKLHQDTFSLTQTKASDILQLKLPAIQKSFFRQLDSMLKIQYPNNDQDKDIFVDLRPKMLSQFLSELDTNTLIKNGAFDKSYHFNIAPPMYKDTKACSDQITLEYDTHSNFFTLIISNRFYAEWCQESAVRYFFIITNKKVLLLDRTEAG